MKTCLRFVLPLLLLTVPAVAEVRLPGFYGDHMVLQQQVPIRIRGWADEAESVHVTLNNVTASAVGGKDGRWQVELPAMQASSKSLVLQVRGKGNTMELKDVLIGEVWLCSGQSNMEWPVSRSANAESEISNANHPLIRHIKIPRKPSTVALDDVAADWQICSPETAGSFTACGYFMSRRLQKELNVPIGLVNSSWGGTRVEPWTPPVGFENVAALSGIHKSLIGRTPGTVEYTQSLTKHVDSLEQWLVNARQSLKTGAGAPPSPAFPDTLQPYRSHQDPTMLYNGMIHALVGFPIRGAIWYQGESNRADGMLYFEKKKALISGWRELWGQGHFPFYFVQIAPYQYGQEDPAELARFWEAQSAVQQIPATGMVVTNDIADLKDIHPVNKQDVGLRLANLALRHQYGRTSIVAESPEFESLQTAKDHLLVHFRKTAGGLKTRDSQSPSHFEIIGGGSGGFRPATAVVIGDAVKLTSPDVPQPTAFRFAWHKLAEPNLTGGSGLPVAACRGGRVPDFFDNVPDSSEYHLVYELDAAGQSGEAKYSVDNSANVEAFDRVAYQLDLGKAGAVSRSVFVSMSAFTDDVTKIALPTVASGAHFQQAVASMNVYSNVPGVETGEGLNGNIEFWPNNYGPDNAAGVSGASASQYDFGDAPSGPVNGYGCLQVHNTAAKQTVFSVNHWTAGNKADVGIGNSSGRTRDWTFTGNAGSYDVRRLRVFVRTQ